MKAIPEMSLDSRAVCERLSRAIVGEVVTYKELCELTKRDIQHRDRHILATAIGAQLREGVVFSSITNVGVKRLADVEIVSIGEQAIPRIRRAARRAARKLASVKSFDEMPREQKTRHNALLSVLGAVAHFTDTKRVAKVESKVASTEGATLPLAKTLEAFSG